MPTSHSDWNDLALVPPVGALHASFADALSDRYLVERELGRGGMATVYLVKDVRHDRLVALKVLRPELAEALGSQQRFLREIKTAARLDHPLILPLLDSGEAAAQLWYTMPYVEGESLRDRISREGPLPIEDAVTIAREVTDALAYAHGHAVIHRDIKPGNVLLSDGHVRVADFGIAKAMRAAGSEQLTVTGLIVGTPAYMSPEQASGQADVDHRSDVYAVGCVLYEMLTGKPPFTGPTLPAILAKRFTEPAPSVRQLRPEVPEALDRAVTKALATVPEDRFQTAAEFRDVLTNLPGGTSAPLRLGRRLLLTGVAAFGLYAACALIVLGAVRVLTNSLGLPDWVVPGAVTLLGLGLPVVLMTAVVQQRHALGISLQLTTRLTKAPHWLTWRRAIGGGALAFAALGVATAGYMALRALGIGPVRTLLAAGALQPRERLLLADFQNRTRDTLVGSLITEAMRIDLAQSPVINLMPPAGVVEVLARMQRPSSSRLDAALAREVALREGIKAVVTGEVASVGPQYVLSAQLVSAHTGEVLTARRETARDSTELIRTIDRLSRKLRERVGESLKAIRAEPPLEHLTTSSLEALQLYSRAERAREIDGDFEGAVALLDDAIALDSGFAMAYRRLGAALGEVGPPERINAALTKAYQLRDRLPERERYHARASYYLGVTHETEKAAAIYRALLAIYPDDITALHNLAFAYEGLGQGARSEELHLREIALDSSNFSGFGDLIETQVILGKWREAEATLARGLRLFPNHGRAQYLAILMAAAHHDYAAAEAYASAMKERQAESPFHTTIANAQLKDIALVRGRLAETEGYLRQDLEASVRAGNPYLGTAFSLAGLDLEFRNRPARASATVRAALARYPLDSFKPRERPYLALAGFYARSGKPKLARALLAEHERVRDRALEDGDAEAGRHGFLGELAIAENRLTDAAAEFRAQTATRGAWCALCGIPDLGRVYDRMNQPDSAIVIYERYLSTPWIHRLEIDAVWLPRIYQRLGELYEQRGDRAKAMDYYGRFVDLWKDCDPELRPAVARARAALKRLSAEEGA